MGLAVTAFLVVIFFFQHLIVRLHINDEGIDEECGGDQQQDVSKRLADGRKQDQQDHADVEDGRCDLAAPQRAIQPAFLADGDETADRHARLLDQKQHQHADGERILIDEQHQQRQLQQLIGDRVDDLADFGDHMITTGDEAVEEVGDLHHGQDQCGIEIIDRLLCVQISHDKVGDQCDAQVAQQIWYGEQLSELHGMTSHSVMIFVPVSMRKYGNIIPCLPHNARSGHLADERQSRKK